MSPPLGKVYNEFNPDDDEGDFFYPCHSSCVTCDDINQDSCYSCVDPNKRVRNDSKGTNDCIVCETVDGLYTHSDSTTGYCSVCDSNCLRCTTVGAMDGLCQECKSGYFMDLTTKTCNSSCPDGTY